MDTGKESYLAAKFEEYSNTLMKTYADFFDADGFTNMWGRSNIYRNAATSAFDGNMMLKHWEADPGLARRISSGSLLQFLQREDFLYKGVPTLGILWAVPPLWFRAIPVQNLHSSLRQGFLVSAFTEDHPFWTAKENNGTWEKLKIRK